MTSNSRRLYGLAGLVTIVSVLQLVERDWLSAAIGMVLATTFALTAATGFRERSVAGKWTYYGLLGVAFILLVIRLFARLSRTS